MKNVYLFQPQYSVVVNGNLNFWLPYSVGCLWSYASQFDAVTNNYKLKDLFFKREPVEDVIAKLDNPAVCGFSCYVWDRRYCIAVANAVREKWPECHIVFGGPEINAGTLSKVPAINSVILAEGEENFVQLLSDLLSNNAQDLYAKKRMTVLDFPSPYALGLFDKLVADNPTVTWAMVLETNRGCPFSCTFCDWGSATYSKVKRFDLDRIKLDMDWAAKNPIGYIMCADANFGVFKERDVEIAKMLRVVGDSGKLETVNVQYAKNSTDVIFKIASILGNLSRGITVSVQSMNDDTLKAIERKNLDINNISRLMELSEKYNVSTYTEVILGLPLETLETWKSGFTELLELGQHTSIDMWLCQLLENSELNSFKHRMQYGIKSVEVSDYMPLIDDTDSDCRDIPEVITIVTQTNTMSSEELIEGFMYGWLIIQFHIAGYSQMYAKFCRNVANVSYRDFYDKAFDLVKADPITKQHYDALESDVRYYLSSGVAAAAGRPGHRMFANYLRMFFQIKEQIGEFSRTVASQFLNEDLLTTADVLQNNTILDLTKQYPYQIKSEYNISTWEKVESKYMVTPKLDAAHFNLDALYTARRTGLIKNNFILIE